MRRDGCWEARILWIVVGWVVQWVVQLHVVVNCLAYALRILEDLALGCIVVFCILNQALEVAFQVREGWVFVSVDAVFDGVES